jgi:uncharacterized protein (DUF1330 family)
MLNLLKFKEVADYGDMTGEEMYAQYAKKTGSLIAEVGAKVIFMGKTHQILIGPEDKVWDKILIVEYPSRQALLQMLQMDVYKENAKDRTAALEDSRLIVNSSEG